MVEELTGQEIGRVLDELEKADEYAQKGALFSFDGLITFLSGIGLAAIAEKLKEYFKDGIVILIEFLKVIVGVA